MSNIDRRIEELQERARKHLGFLVFPGRAAKHASLLKAINRLKERKEKLQYQN